ncbi:putative bifunctional diguanylate cyclase/phosphodiesterase [Ferrimonas balearica]|uniref:putative bifunctional diguanylate cyclase/phosphodiesterase n=1 Tax=Ferrimonas balearica TaxID=44012 RepID=UPI001C9940BB|nr:EAL domain-containing protein [Ferrimonas balearica]MBY5991903.1 EAL domain-containing protein [Ferrimonas balearica]
MKQGRADAIEQLIQLPEKQSGDFDHTAQVAAQLVCEHLGVETASVWLLSEDQRQLTPVCRHQSEGSGILDAPLHTHTFPDYFDHLLQHRFLRADAARLHPATKAFNAPYLVPNGIHAMLDAGIRINGHLEGVICVESLRPRNWSDEDAHWVGQLADQLALALATRRQSRQAGQIGLFRQAMEQASQRMAIIDEASLTVSYVNQAYLRLAGCRADDLLGQPVQSLMLFRQNPKVAERALETVIDTGFARGESQVVDPLGRMRWIDFRVNRMVTEDGRPYLVLYSDDVTAERAYQSELEQLAWRCSLTGLYNRAYLQRGLAESTPAALLLVDLDGFKAFNDLHGHDMGDRLLTELARRLGHCAERLGATLVARIGADEFVVRFDTPPAMGLEAVANTLVARLSQPVAMGTRQFPLRLSVAAVCQATLGQALEAMTALDLAMAKAKQSGRVQLFDATLRERFCETVQIEQDLRHALARKEFELHYQPLVDLDSGQVRGAEALLRWQHPQKGRMAPARFIEIAESSGAIEPIGRWVLETALYQLHLWQRRWPALEMHVNVSVKQLLGGELYEICWAQLNRYRLTPGTLVLEITETTLMEDIQAVSRLCTQLGELGIVLAIDDFGTGYSSMRYLQRLPVGKLKIDRSFVADLEQSRESREIVPAIIAMGQALDLVVTAEGVENPFQREFLKRHGCDQVQGFLYSEALSRHEFEDRFLPVSVEPR